jgi:hypothetical protein
VSTPADGGTEFTVTLPRYLEREIR